MTKANTIPDYALRDLGAQVAQALAEDMRDGDLTAALIPEGQQARGRLITRESAVLCGTAWVDEVFRQLGDQVTVSWHRHDGDRLTADDVICELSGDARQILTGERTAMNFLQTLSATASAADRFASAVKDKPITVLDTRKTIPGLRGAQKYAVLCGGCENHRIGLYDAFLIKENHITACGSISEAIQRARELAPGKRVIVEVESLEQLDEALTGRPEQIMLDNFSTEMIQTALDRAGDISAIEISGGLTLDDLSAMELSRPVYVSVGAITKHIQAVDLSLRLEPISA